LYVIADGYSVDYSDREGIRYLDAQDGTPGLLGGRYEVGAPAASVDEALARWDNVTRYIDRYGPNEADETALANLQADYERLVAESRITVMPSSLAGAGGLYGDPAFQLSATTLSAGQTISSYTPSFSNGLRNGFLTATRPGYELRDRAYQDFSDGNYVTGSLRYLGSLGLRTLATAQLPFDLTVSAARGHGFQPTPMDKQDAALLSMVTGAMGAMRKAIGFAAERSLLSNAEARVWYNQQLKTLDTSGPLTESTALRVHDARNALKQQTRDLMSDRAVAEQLARERPLEPFRYYVDKYTAQGYNNEALWQRIIQGSTTANPTVNSKFGIK
jgi:hypothetical protein